MRVGIIFTFLSFLGIVTKPTFGAVADRFRNVKFMLIVLLAIVIITMLGMNFIPPIDIRTCGPATPCTDYFNQTRNDSISEDFCEYFCRMCSNCSIPETTTNISIFNASEIYGQINCSDWPEGFSCNPWCDKIPLDDSSVTLQLGLFTALIIGAWASFNVAVTLTDAACYTVLEDKAHLYGRQRLWGVIGWGLFAAFTGYLNNVASSNSGRYDYSPGFYILVILLLFDMLAVRHLKIKNTLVAKAMCKNLKKLLKDPRITVFLVGTFAIGALTGLIRCYLFWYLRVLNANQLLLGLSSGSQCFLGELPFFFFSGWIINKLGHINTVTMAFLAYSIRFLGYYFMTDPWWTLPLELLQGPAYAVFYAAMTSYAKTVAYPGTEATVQGLLGGTFEGLGIASGKLLGGVGFSLLDERKTFLCAAIISFIGSILFALTHKFLQGSKEEESCHTPQSDSLVPSKSSSDEFTSKSSEPLRSQQPKA